MVNQKKVHIKIYSADTKERIDAAYQLGVNFSVFLDKEQAWDDLHQLTQDKDSFVRWSAVSALGLAFPNISNKEQAWDDLHQLTQDKDSFVRWNAVETLGLSYPYISDKQQAWEDLVRLIQDNEFVVLRATCDVLKSIFPIIINEKQAWEDLHFMTKHPDSYMRWSAAKALNSIFPYISEKKQAWNDMIRLMKDTDPDVQQRAADVIGNAFSQVNDKKQAWIELQQLIQDRDFNPQHGLRIGVAKILGTTYPYITYKKWKEQAWKDLQNMSEDDDYGVRAVANHSLGKISIFKATETENEEVFRNELEKALEFFEKSLNEAYLYNPSRFCLPFYRSFYAITFSKQEAEIEVKKYLNEAKIAVEGSESKEKLLETLENLSNAMREAQKASKIDISRMKYDLNTYRQYCERVIEILDAAEKKTPGATRVIRRGLPIINQRINKILKEIQEKAKLACEQSKETPVEKIACFVSQEVKKWEVSNQEQMTKNVENLIFSLKAKIPNIEANKHIFEEIESIKREKDLVIQYQRVPILISLIPQTVIGGNMNGDIYTNISVTGNNNILGRNNVININQQQLAKIPDEYAKSLQAFSEAVNNQLKKYNVSKEEAAPVQESINELAKEVEGIKSEKIDIEKQEDIKYKLKKIALKLRKVLPDFAETVATFTPLAPFSKIIGKGVEEIVKE